MLTPITIRYPVRPVRRSLVTGQVADLFGLDEAEPPQAIADGLTLDVRPGDVVLFTGPSGSGKSSIMKAVGDQLGAIDATRLELTDGPLVEALPGPVEDRLAVLAGCGLSEARVLLRTPAELSDGQRYRFRIAYALAGGTRPILLDEFAAVLDRPLAKVLAFNLRKLATRTGVGVLCATTHDDLTTDLGPDLWVRCQGGGRVEAERRGVKKKRSASPASCGCPPAPDPTGRTSLGGITAPTGWPSSAGSSSCGTGPTRSASACSGPRPRRCPSGVGTSDWPGRAAGPPSRR